MKKKIEGKKYLTSIQIDKDIEEFYKNIDMITFLENYQKGQMINISKTEIINNLIRKYMYEVLGISGNNKELINEKWEKYKKENGLGGIK